MRITSNIITQGFLNSLNKSLQRQNTLQEQLADGKAIHRPSDDPVRVVRSLRFNSNLTANEQFTQNVKDAISWMETSDGALSNMSSIMIRAKEIVIQAANPNPDTAYETIGTEIDGLINSLIDTANSKIGDRFVFAGQMDKTQPLLRTGDIITYQGDTNKISLRIQPGATSPAQDSINLTANEVFGDNLELLNHLVEIKNHLQSGTVDSAWLSDTALANIDTDYNNLLKAQTDLGVRMSTYEMTQTMLEESYVTITGDIAGNEDLDIPKAIIDYKTCESVYRTALSVGAKIIPPSLVDFLS